jgi:hypothetical protein
MCSRQRVLGTGFGTAPTSAVLMHDRVHGGWWGCGRCGGLQRLVLCTQLGYLCQRIRCVQNARAGEREGGG